MTEPATTRRWYRPSTGASAAAAVINLIATIIVVILVAHIVFTVFEANSGNNIVDTTADWASGLAWQFKDVFQPDDAKMEVVVNYGLAALVYLVIAKVIISLIRRVG